MGDTIECLNYIPFNTVVCLIYKTTSSITDRDDYLYDNEKSVQSKLTSIVVHDLCLNH